MVASSRAPRSVDVAASLAQAAAAHAQLDTAATVLLSRLGLRRGQAAAALASLERHPSLGRAVAAARQALVADTTPELWLSHLPATPPPRGLRV